MQHRSDYRISNVDNKPGVYVFRDRLGDVIYVGKAKSLKRRLASYFQPSRGKTADPKLRSLINSIEYFDLFPVRTEEEAMLLESRFIKQYSPRYNVVLRDDKRFLLIKIVLNSPYPRLSLTRLRKDDGALYFGPFPQAGVLRVTVTFLAQYFGLRSCTPKVPGERDYTHCLDHVIRYCSAPCIGKISRQDYGTRIQGLIDVIQGKTDDLVAYLAEKMNGYAGKQNFEMAAKMRDVMDNVKTVFAAQNRTFERATFQSFPGRAGVAELQQVLELAKAPRHLECFDISNIAGTFAVGSMVCFVDGAPSKKDYRHFRIKTVKGIDDFAMMREVVHRRYRRLLDEKRPLPDLIVIDGGRGQLNAAFEILTELGLAQQPVIGLAKKREEIFTVYDSEPTLLERHQASLKLLQAIRDEAHRFALSFHQGLRRNRILNSILDEVPGVGEKRKAEILKTFGSVRNLRKHTAATIAERLPSIGQKLAAEIVAHLRRVDGY